MLLLGSNWYLGDTKWYLTILQMVRTRATTLPTPTPARQGASEQTTGALAQGGAVARGRGRGRRRTPLEAEEKHLVQLGIE